MLEDCTPWKVLWPCVSEHGMDHFILVFGGRFITNNKCVPQHAIWMYNLYTQQWRKHVIPQGQTVPASRSYACAVVIGSHVYMFWGSHVCRTQTN